MCRCPKHDTNDQIAANPENLACPLNKLSLLMSFWKTKRYGQKIIDTKHYHCHEVINLDLAVQTSNGEVSEWLWSVVQV